MKFSIVIPSNRPKGIQDFLAAWKFEDAEVIVVEDGPTRSFALPPEVRHFSWEEIDSELGDDAWIIPRKTGAIRSYGFLKAEGDVIVSLDDDCLPVRDQRFLDLHEQALSSVPQFGAWVSTLDGIKPRGLPFRELRREWPCAISHGLWLGVPDFDAVTQLSWTGRVSDKSSLPEQTIPPGQFFPMCSMNLAFRQEFKPAMYFLLMGPSWPYSRFDDIWCGLFAKKIADHLGYSVHSGLPYVQHSRASDVFKNLEQELSGYSVNEWLWKHVDKMRLTEDYVSGCYLEISEQLPEGEYWETLGKAMRRWVACVAKLKQQEVTA